MKKRFVIILFLSFLLSSYSQNKTLDSLLLVLPKIENKLEKTKTLNAISNSFVTINPEKIIFYAQQALEVSINNGFKKEQANAYFNLGTGNIILGNYKEALSALYDAKGVFENKIKTNQSNDLKQSLARTYGNIGIVFSEQSNYTKAFQSYLKAIAIYEKLDNKKTLSKLYNNIAVIYKNQNEIDIAFSFFIKAKNIQEQYRNLFCRKYCSKNGNRINPI